MCVILQLCSQTFAFVAEEHGSMIYIEKSYISVFCINLLYMTKRHLFIPIHAIHVS